MIFKHRPTAENEGLKDFRELKTISEVFAYMNKSNA